uniref:ubiquitinyl hydrolase 1 n=1 Tax=Philodina roseola TaxID=96448 RepID=B6S359_PHIRO|nr:zinc finger protein Cezanne-like protein [Philodina roseola]
MFDFWNKFLDASNHQVVHRALSTVSANQTLVHQQRNLLAKNYRRISVNDEIVTIDHTDADASFLLPNLSDLPDEIRIRVTDSLVDTTTMNTLEENKRLNWWVNKKLPCPKLYPLLTNGDGNCLLHATSLAMWGFHDHSLSMRKALNETMITLKPNNSLYRRWRWAQSVQNKKYGLVFSEQEWNEEWKSLLRLSSAEPRISQINSSDSATNNQVNRTKSLPIVSSSNTGGSTQSTCQSTRQYYESLEEFHVYVLANNIRRPIIIYSDRVLRTNDGEAISPIEFGGIYLPLEIPAEKCHKQPVFLAFDAAHFSALVPLEQNSKTSNKATYRIPLIDIETNDLLPIHYFVDPGPDFAWPIDEELSDEKIHLYTHFGSSRMDVLENYLNLSEELSPLTQLNSPTGSISQPSEESATFTNEPSRSSTIPTDASTISHETTNSISTPIIQKKSSRQTLNAFSKIIRRTFIEPFSTGKRASFKLRRQQDSSDVTLTDQSELKRRISSPLLNPRTNVLKIIMTDFQPKRPKTSDNMIKNYIDACLNEYRLEKNKQKPVEISHDENYQSNTTVVRSTTNTNGTQQIQPMATYRTYTSTNSSSSRTQNNNESMSSNTHDKRRVVPLSTNVVNPVNKPTQKNYDVDDNDDDSSLIDTIPLSSNINYVQKQTLTTTQVAFLA